MQHNIVLPWTNDKLILLASFVDDNLNHDLFCNVVISV